MNAVFSPNPPQNGLRKPFQKGGSWPRRSSPPRFLFRPRAGAGLMAPTAPPWWGRNAVLLLFFLAVFKPSGPIRRQGSLAQHFGKAVFAQAALRDCQFSRRPKRTARAQPGAGELSSRTSHAPRRSADASLTAGWRRGLKSRLFFSPNFYYHNFTTIIL